MRLHTLILLVLLASGTTVLWSQTATTAQLSGRITDPTEAVILGAQVTVTNTETGIKKQATTNELGYFTISLLPPGQYRINAEAAGFRPVTRDGVTLQINQAARLDFTLQVGSISESIEVSGAAPLVESGSSALGQVIENKSIRELPLNGRNFLQLAVLGPGVTGVGFGAKGAIMSGTRPDDLRPGTELFSNGNREQSNNFLLDGADNNFRRNGLITLRPSVEAVQEFKIQTNLFAAEQGRKAGATVNVITKSGSNQWHGSAYEFLRNSNVDARNYFARPQNAKPEFRQNQFGASLGGPIVHNKLFFFTNYEGYRKRLQTPLVATVPTAAMRSGDFSAVRDIFDPFTTRPAPGTRSGSVRDPFPSRQIPASRFDAVDRKLIQAYPLPQLSGLVNNETTNPMVKQRWDQGDVRIDYNVSTRDAIFGRYSRQDTTTTMPSTFLPTVVQGVSTPVGLGNDDPAGDSVLPAQHAVINWTHTISSSFLVEARMGYARFHLDYRQAGAPNGSKLGEQLGVANANQGPLSDGFPIFSPSGYTGIGQSRSMPTIRFENTFNPLVNFTKTKGIHTLKFGFDLRRRQIIDFNVDRGCGKFTFNPNFTNDPNVTATTGDSMASFLLGTAATIEQDLLLVWAGIRVTETGSFFQDDVRVTNRLTLNLGIRYEYDTPPYEVANRWANFDLTTGKLRIAGFNSDRYAGVKPDPNNFAPRFGFAYQLLKTTVLRGGFGIFYSTQGNGDVYFRLHRQVPFGPVNIESVDQYSASPRRVQDGLRLINVVGDFATVVNRPGSAPLGVVDDAKSGYAQQYNIQVQQELPHWNMVVKAGYVGNLSRQLINTYNPNQAIPGPGSQASRQPLQYLAPGVVSVKYAVTDGRANYHALQMTAEKRFSSGLSFLTAYTFSHSIDNVANEQGGADNGPLPQDSRYRNADRGTSGFDIKHRLIHSMKYALPVGRGRRFDFSNRMAKDVLGDWQVNTIIVSQTGLPFTPVLQSSVSNAGSSRPDRLRNGEVDHKDPAYWFDTSFNKPGAAWGVPIQFTYGNSGRNILRGPGRVNLDFSVFKDFPIREGWKLQFRTEFFNLFNTPQFDLPNGSIGSPQAGIITATVGNPRQLQFALRLAF